MALKFFKHNFFSLIFVLLAFHLAQNASSKPKFTDKHYKHKGGDLSSVVDDILSNALDQAYFEEHMKDKNTGHFNRIYDEIKNIIEQDQKYNGDNSKVVSKNNLKEKDANMVKTDKEEGKEDNGVDGEDDKKQRHGSELQRGKGEDGAESDEEPMEMLTDEFAVEINGDAEVASEVADTHGFTVLKHVKALGSVYRFKRSDVSEDGDIEEHQRSKRSAHQALLNDPKVVRVDRQTILVRLQRVQWYPVEKMLTRHDDDDDDEDDDGGGDDDKYSRRSEEGDEENDKDRTNSNDNNNINHNNVNSSNNNSEVIHFNDPMFDKQWYLWNRGQTGGMRGYDLNVVPAWRMGYTGRGVVVSILDDGLDHTHPDIIANYDAEASADLSDLSDLNNDPMPNLKKPHSNHGTMCAGEVAAQANNSFCCVGIAFNANIGGIRLLDGRVTDLLEAQALLHNNQHIHIYSASWGPVDNGKTMEGPHRYCKRALKEGVMRGRGGKGSIFVWATGNGGVYGDDCNCDGYVASPYTLAIGSISDQGLSTYFSEVCSSTMAVVFTGGSHQRPVSHGVPKIPHVNVVTTDVGGACTTSFMGTSSAAPLAAGCVALALEANAALTWRDVQHIVAETSIIPSEQEAGWVMNGGGYHVNERMGFGVLDCAGMVKAALTWNSVQERLKCVVKYSGKPRSLKAGRSIEVSFDVSEACTSSSSSSQRIDSLEHVQVGVVMEHRRRGDVSIEVVSADGTRSAVLKRRPYDASEQGIRFTFMSVRHWGEAAKGHWRVLIQDHTAGGAGEGVGPTDGQLHDRKLTDDEVYGSSAGEDGPNEEDAVVTGELMKLSLIFHGVEGSFENHVRWEGLDGRVTEDGKGDDTEMGKRKRTLVDETGGISIDEDDESSNEDDAVLHKLLRGIKRRKSHARHRVRHF